MKRNATNNARPAGNGLVVCLLLAAALLCAGIAQSRANPVIWGVTGVLTADGALDATRIPTSTGTSPVRYTNVNGQGYDIVVTTSGLSGAGAATYLGDDGWWFQGTSVTSGNYSIVTFRFYQTGTNIPIGINGTDVVFQDAEVSEYFGGFSYFDKTGAQIPLLFNNPIFTYSYGGNFALNYAIASNAAPDQSGTQNGKTMEINMTAMTISGFTIGVHRGSAGAGSVIMMGFGNLLVAP